MRFTVLGSGGFIGSHLAAYLGDLGHDVETFGRDESALKVGSHGHLIDCAGLTSDFRHRLADTVEAHACRVLDHMRSVEFESYLYLSSTRVYRRSPTGNEDDVLPVLPGDGDDIYGISKIMGEAACLSCGREGTKVVRLSNVYGPDFASGNFLFALVLGALRENVVVLRGSPETPRDFVSIDDVVEILPRIAVEGTQYIYNVAAGRSVRAGDLAALVATMTGSRLEVQPSEEVIRFPVVSIERVAGEFGFAPRELEDELPALIDAFREHISKKAVSR